MNDGGPGDEDRRRRRLRHRSHHRGTKELDILLGAFADAHLGAMDDGALRCYERVLTVEDPVMLDWLFGRAQPPDEAMNDVLVMLLDFARRRR